jgi:hypothetical protein
VPAVVKMRRDVNLASSGGPSLNNYDGANGGQESGIKRPSITVVRDGFTDKRSSNEEGRLKTLHALTRRKDSRAMHGSNADELISDARALTRRNCQIRAD